MGSFVPYLRFHVLVIYGICLSLSDLLHLVWYSLGPSMLMKMALLLLFSHSATSDSLQSYGLPDANGIISLFLWLSSIPLGICILHTTSALPTPLSITRGFNPCAGTGEKLVFPCLEVPRWTPGSLPENPFWFLVQCHLFRPLRTTLLRKNCHHSGPRFTFQPRHYHCLT